MTVDLPRHLDPKVFSACNPVVHYLCLELAVPPHSGARQAAAQPNEKVLTQRLKHPRFRVPDLFSALAAEVQLLDPVPPGMYGVLQLNASCLSSAQRILFKPGIGVDLAMVQEARTLTDDIFANEIKFVANGWYPHISPAQRTAANSASAGVAIFAKRPVALKPHLDIIPEIYRHRICACHVGGLVKGGLHCICLYPWCGEGLSARNRSLYECCAAFIRVIRGPWILSADHNIDVQVLRESGFLDMIDAVAVVPQAPTCHGKHYDFSLFLRHCGAMY